MNEKYLELEKRFNQHYKVAQEARGGNDFYNLVIHLRDAAQCLIDMTEHCSADKKGPLMERSRDLLDKAKQWQEAHPECFANTNQSAHNKGDTKKHVVDRTGTTFKDIVGCEDVKEFVTKQYIKRFSEKYRAVFADDRGGALERGILLFGLPGTGKTMIARAIATEVNANFISLKASDLKDRFYGETEKKIREVYEDAAALAAKENRISIIFIDEIETLLPSRSSDVQNHESSAVTEFLTVLDGFEKEKMANIITVAASNYPNRIDAAALRPGRLGAWFRVDVPPAELRERLIKKHFSKGYTLDEGAMSAAIKMTKGFSSADVVAICGRIKNRLAEYGIAAVDKGLSEEEVIKQSSHVTVSVVEKVLKTANSSISQVSILELAEFEKNYNYRSANGGIVEFMKKLT